MSDRERLILDVLSAPTSQIAYTLSVALARLWPDRHILETEDPDLHVGTFLARVPCEVVVHPQPHPQIDTGWSGPERGLFERLVQGHRTLTWEGEIYEIIDLAWSEPMGHQSRTALVGRNRAVVEALATRIAQVNNEVPDDEVMVFANGCWQRSQELRAAIRGATFDNLVLPPPMASSLLADFQQFLGARAEYERYGVAWKRGVLFLGPPGNGKTHCVKALINALGLPCLYVQSFEAPYTNPQRNVHQVFERARRMGQAGTSPCALVLEDLDSLVTKTTRSFFLNELDGFAANTGIVTIATTNHAERLDPAILDRPSRFDRKYHFGLPAFDERVAYLQLWSRQSREEARMEEQALAALAQATDGFSYAYLKELMVCSLVRWISDGQARTLPAVAHEQVTALRAQMQSGSPEAERRQTYVEEWQEDYAPSEPEESR